MLAPLLALLLSAAEARSWHPPFADAIAKVESMTYDSTAQSLVRRHGLDLVNVTWEDTGRSKGSAWGPNISDMTIGVRDPSGALHPMPVIRFDNFRDRTADIRASHFGLQVGNERGRRTTPVSLLSLLRNPRQYLSDPSSWTGRQATLAHGSDEHVLVSAQACFLPIPRDGQATFTPVLYNYQSSPGNPAVLAIVATREGTSMQVVENESGYLSEALYFNDDGDRAPFTAERLSDFQDRTGDHSPVSADSGLSVVLLIQVPLKQRAVPRDAYGYGPGFGESAAGMPVPMAEAARKSDVEQAVVSHGPIEGPFSEMNGLPIERDPRFPVRVTVQFYKATSSGAITGGDVAAIRRQIDRVYANGDFVGSLVTEGFTGRPTEWVDQPRVSRREGNATWADGYWDWMRP
jgi:hypothetical protein